MNKLSSLAYAGILFAFISPAQLMAQVDPFIATGEDIDCIINNEEASTLILLEDKLEQFSLFRDLQALFTNTRDLNIDLDEDKYGEHVVTDPE